MGYRVYGEKFAPNMRKNCNKHAANLGQTRGKIAANVRQVTANLWQTCGKLTANE
jgi:hypothetical protein